MHTLTLLAALGVFSSSVLAAPKDCEALRAEIEVKIQAAGVASYTLEIVTNDGLKTPAWWSAAATAAARKSSTSAMAKRRL